MIKKIYLNKALPFPLLSLVLMLNCAIVSLSAHWFSSFDAIFNAFDPVSYWWQRFTTLFSHGNIWGVPLKIHFTGNMIGILVLGIYCERVLPKKHFLAFFTISLVMSTGFAYVFNVTGNGISSVVWSFIPPVAYGVFLTLKQYRKQAGILINLVITFMIFWGIVIYPMVYGHSNYHNFGVLVGVGLTIVMRKVIAERLKGIFLNTPLQKETCKARGVVWALPIFVIGLMIFTKVGVIDTIKMVGTIPERHQNVATIIEEGNQIQMTFDRPMDTQADLLQIGSEFDLGAEVIYLNDRVVCLRFSKNLEGCGYIQIRGDFVSKDGKRYPLKLDYKEEA